MDHVALDLLKLPEEVYRGKRYDTVAICVDRLSGWLIATPHLAKGCSGREVALAMLDKWDIFGIPAVVSSDRGSHFVANWWQTLCGALGVRVAFAQAYHHQASRAEVACRVLQTLLRKMVDRERPSWVEALPAALRMLNDLPGPTGYSAYQLAFGRDRPLAGVPRQPPRIAEDALDFLERMEDLRKSAARQLEVMHQRDADLMAQWRTRRVEFKAGDRVWYHRPAPVGGRKLRSNWIGPCTVLRRESQSSYLIEVKPDVSFAAHTDDLKEYIEPEEGAAGLPLNYYRLTETPEEALPDEFIVDRLVDHRILPDGTVEYKTLWRGYPVTEFTWEPSTQFIQKYSADWADYVQRHGLVDNVARQLDPRPTAANSG
jgi:hypothetical protein